MFSSSSSCKFHSRLTILHLEVVVSGGHQNIVHQVVTRRGNPLGTLAAMATADRIMPSMDGIDDVATDTHTPQQFLTRRTSTHAPKKDGKSPNQPHRISTTMKFDAEPKRDQALSSPPHDQLLVPEPEEEKQEVEVDITLKNVCTYACIATLAYVTGQCAHKLSILPGDLTVLNILLSCLLLLLLTIPVSWS